MRLIDADYLKEVISNNSLIDFTDDDLFEIIDNAPAVDLTKNQYYDKGFITAMKAYSRPKGEWIFLGDNPNRDNPNPNHKWSCNKCGRGVKEQENFCPNCGARMKGGAE